MIEVITPDELAEKFKLSRRNVIDLVTRQPGFPESLTGRRKPRWDAAAVDKFFRRKSAQNAHNSR